MLIRLWQPVRRVVKDGREIEYSCGSAHNDRAFFIVDWNGVLQSCRRAVELFQTHVSELCPNMLIGLKRDGLIEPTSVSPFTIRELIPKRVLCVVVESELVKRGAELGK